MKDTGGVWPHLASVVLPQILTNTGWLALGVGCLTVILGVSLAWFVTFCEFPGRPFFEWALLMPLAMPTYVLGFVWIGLLDYSGIFPTWLREVLPLKTDWIPEIRSRGGIIFVMGLALYPYVYLMSRNCFQNQEKSMTEAALTLGMNRWNIFTRITLPLARPWIFAGLILVIMETLADFGTVSVFNYDTFTTAIYKSWFGMFSIEAAGQLSSVLILMIFMILGIEWAARGNRRFSAGKSKPFSSRFHMRRRLKVCISAYCGIILTLGFLLPVAQLFIWNIGMLKDLWDPRYVRFIFNTVILSCLAALFVSYSSFHLSQAMRLAGNSWVKGFLRMGLVGYAVPGTVLAVGVFSSLFWMEELFFGWWQNMFGTRFGVFFTGTLAAMMIAYLVRFLAVGFHPVDSAMQKVTLHVEEAARGVGLRGLSFFSKIQLPVIRSGLLSAGLLVFVDVMKEMPITLMTRPFGWDTLAVKIFELTSEGEWQKAAFPSVILVMTGLIAVLFLARQKNSSQVL